MNRKPLFDLALLLLVFWFVWYLKEFLPASYRAPAVILLVSLTAFIVLKVRGVRLKELGLISRSLNQAFFREIMTLATLIFAIQFAGIMLIGGLLGNPEAGSAIEQQPQSPIGFLVDIVVVTWFFIGLGEEFIFRGIIINRLQALFKNPKISGNTYVISALQAIWFGAAHPSQGLSGMIIAGMVGFALGVYYLKRKEQGLWPLVFAHALIDTVVLSIAYFTDMM